MAFKVYKVTNNLNGKEYVGITKNSLKVRFVSHATATKCLTGLSHAIRKYGRENFTISLLEEFDTIDTALEREKFWILNLNTLGVNGYNRSIGGAWSGQTGRKHARPSKEHMLKLHNAKKKAIIATNKSTGETYNFESINQAASSLNIIRTAISNILNGWSKFARQQQTKELYTFMYEGVSIGL